MEKLQPFTEDTLRAMAFIRSLAGRWRFEMWSNRQDEQHPACTGTRIYTPLFDDLVVQSRTDYDGSALRVQGMLGYDPKKGCYFISSVSNEATQPNLSIGKVHTSQLTITFTPVMVFSDAQDEACTLRSVMRILDNDQHIITSLCTAVDQAGVEVWHAIYRREK